MVKVLLVDEQYLTACGLGLLLNEQDGFEVVGIAKNLDDAQNLIGDNNPDIMLLDVSTQNQDTLSKIEALISFDPKLKTIITSRYSPIYVVARLLHIRVQGYITKDADFEEVVKGIQAVSNEEEFVSADVLNQLALRHVGESNSPSFTKLSERETQIMEMILKGHKVQDCAELLHINPKTVNSYRYRIFNKLQATSDVELVLLAILYGLIDKKTFLKELDFINQ